MDGCFSIPLSLILCAFLFENFGNSAESEGPPSMPIAFSVKRFGAAGDGELKDTGAIQKAVDAASAAGGGTVLFPAGTYLTGTIFLKSKVTLHLAAGATLLGSTDLEDYPHRSPKIRSYTDNYADQCILYGEELENIAIVGRGVIDGQGASFKSRTYKNRPYIIRIFTSRNILVGGITLRNSAMWVQHYLGCENVTLRGLTVHSRCNANNDMIDIDGCRNVRISDCYGESDDDSITLKSTSEHPCENVAINNCVVSSRCNAIKMGTETHGGFRNIAISNCSVFRTGLAGVALEIVDGGTLDGVTVSNITMRGVRSPIFLRLGNRARVFKKDMPKPGMGSFRNVNISNILATGATNQGCPISGLPGYPIENVSLSSIQITFAGGGTVEDSARAVPEKPSSYPECTMFGKLPAYGFFCRHVKGLTLNNIDLRFAQPDLRPALFLEDVQDLDVSGLKAQSSPGGAPLIIFNDVQGALIRGSIAPRGTATFLSLLGGTKEVSVMGNDLSGAKTAFELGEGVPRNALFSAANRKEN